MNKILFICHGNICRSAMAEFIMKELVRSHGCGEDYHIESAAVSDEESGNGIYPPARKCLERHGIPYDSGKRSRKVRRSDYDRFDLLICMDNSNVLRLHNIIGEDPEGKVRMIMSFCGRDASVADPWYTGDFEATYNDLTESCTALLEASGGIGVK